MPEQPRPFSPRADQTQMLWSDSIAIPAGAGIGATTRIYLGMAHETGLTLRSVYVTTSAGVPRSTTDYFLFRPFVTTVTDGAASVRYISDGRGSNSYSVTADVAFRCHDEEMFNIPLVKGQMVGVDILTTSAVAPGNLPTSVRGSFIAGVIRRGR